jgi:hypothetical protein
MLVTGCSNLDSERYLVSIYKLDNAKEESNVYLKATSPFLSKYYGSYLQSPLIIEKNLPNPAQPSFVQESVGNVILIAEFKNRKNLDRFVEDVDVIKHMNAIGKKTEREIIFVAKDFNPMGMMADTTQLKNFELRGEPTFIMINDISMNSFLNPMTPYRIMRYMNENFPLLKESNVRFIRPLEKVKDLRGNYNFDVLNLSEWPNEQVFDDFHSNQVFIKLATDTRNKAFRSFTEAKATLMPVND